MNRFLILGLSLVVSAMLIQACRQESYWEKTLSGPFTGEPYYKEPSAPVVSSLPLTANLSLDVHRESGTNDPVLCLRQVGGTCVWARVLIPRFDEEKYPRGLITELTLRDIKTTENGFKVLFSSDWTSGGKEEGIIYLGTNYSFRHFALGW